MMENVRRISKKYYLRQIVACFLVNCMFFNVPIVFATPTGSQVVAGSAGVGQAGNTTTVTMGSGRAVINWNSLNTGSNEILQFIKDSGGFAVLNRVIQGGATQFDGSLFGNQGHIIVVNPNGIVFGPTALVQAHKFTASGLDISSTDFMNGHYQFVGGNGTGIVSNYGEISAEQVALIGKQVLNAGVIRSPGGYVLMAAGNRVLLGQDGSNVVVEVDAVAVSDPTDPTSTGMGDVINEGTIEAAGGKIVLAAGDTFSRAIEGLDGLSVAVESGTGRVGQFGALNADGVEGDGGSITLTAGDVVALSSDSITTVNAGTNGDGGEVIVYSPDTALFHSGALVEAKGGSESGDGGFFELSGKEYVGILGDVDMTASNGQVGNFLIDPRNIIIDNSGKNETSGSTSSPWRTWHPSQDVSNLDVDKLEDFLDNSNVWVTTAGGGGSMSGWIKLDAVKDLDYGGGNKLTLRADDYISIYSGIDFHGSGDVTLKADNRINVYATHVHKPGGDFKNTYGIYLNGGTLTMNSGRDGGGEKIRLFDDIKAGNIVLKDNVVLKGTGGDQNQQLVATGTLTAQGNVNKTSAGNLVMAGNSGIKVAGDVETTDGDLKFEDAVIANGAGNQLFNANADGTQLIAKGTITKNTSGDLTLMGGRLNGADDTEIDIILRGDVAVNQGSLIIGLDGSDDDTRVKAGVTLSARDNVRVKDSLYGKGALSLDAGNNLNLHKGVTAVGYLSLVAGNKITSDGVISVTGSSLLMQQGLSIDTADYTFGNQANTNLTLISDNGSVTSTSGDNAANKWSSIGAHANQNITLARSGGKNEIELGDSGTAGKSLWAENGYIDIDGFNVRNSGDFADWDLDAGTWLSIDVVHGIDLGGDLSSGSDMELLADTDTRYGHDVVVGGSINSGGTLDIEGTNVDIQSAHSAGDMDIYAHGLYDKTTPPDELMIASGDVRVHGTLTTTNGHIIIEAADDFGSGGATVGPTFASPGDTSYSATGTIYLDDNVTANGGLGDDVLLNSNTVAAAGVKIESTGDDVILAPGKTMYGLGNLTIKADDDVKLGGTNGSISGSAGDVEAVGDLFITAGDDLYAHGTLTSTGGVISLTSSDTTTYLWDDVTAYGDVFLNNKTVVKASGKTIESETDDVILAADKTLVSYRDLTILAGDDVKLGMDNQFDPFNGSGGDVTAKYDLTITAGDDVYAHGELKSRYGSIEISSGDTTTYLFADATADDDIILNNNTWAADNVTLEAGDNVETYGTLTGAGDLTVEAGDNILFGNDADDYVLVEGTLVAKSGLDWGIFTSGKGSIEAAGNVTAGNMLLSAGAKWPGFSDSHVSVAGNLTTTARRNGDMIVEAHHDITLGGDVDSAGDLVLNADRHSDWWTPDHMMGGDVEVAGTVDARGTIDMYGNNITLWDDVTSRRDMTITADTSSDFADPLPEGDVRAYGELKSRWGSIEISADDDTIYLYDDVDADDDIILNNNTWAADNVTLEAGDNVETYGTLTGAGDLTVEAGDNILFGDDADDYVLVEGTLVAKSGLDWGIFTSGKGSIEAAGDVTAGDMLLSAGAKWPGFSDSHVSVDGMLTTTDGDMIVEAHHDITLGDNVDSAGDLVLNADRHSDWWTPDHMMGGDVEVAGTVDARGTIDMYGNNITLWDDVESVGNMILTADTSSDFADPSPEGDVVAMGNLTSTGGSVSIYSSDDTTYLGGDVTAYTDVLLNNKTVFIGSDDQHVTAGTGEITGTITANNTLDKCDQSLYLLAYDDISLAGDVTGHNGGVSIISKTGKIFTPGGADDTLNVAITGYSNHAEGAGVVLPKDYDIPVGEENRGRAAIVIMSNDTLKLGYGATLTANGTYDTTGAVDDRPGVDFLDHIEGYKNPGWPIDVAIYLASNAGNVSVGSTVNPIPTGGVMVVDAYHTVSPFGTDFLSSVIAGNVSWLEVCSRITPTLNHAIIYGTLPYASDPGAYPGAGMYVLRGENLDVGTGAWVLASNKEAPLAGRASAEAEEEEFLEGGCPALMEWLANEIGIPAEDIQVAMADAFALNTDIQPCEMCARLKDASTILEDSEGTHIPAMAQVVNEFVAPDAPIAPEQMASIASALASPEAGTQYAAAGQWLDALAEYVGILNTEMGFAAVESVAFAGKYVTPITEGDNASLVAYVEARLAALGG